MTLLTVKHATFGYPGRTVLHNISLSLPAGSIGCLLGANGSGKTTLMRSILGVLPLLSGEILLDDVPVQRLSRRKRARVIAWVPQAHDSAFAFTVLEMVMMGLSPHLGPFSPPSRHERAMALAQLDVMGIAALASRSWQTLSGGERQLVLIARALVQRPRLLLLDEPASSLDFGHQTALLDSLNQLRQQGMALLMATHHPLHAHAIADSVICMEPGGNISQGTPRAQLRPEKLAALYRVTTDQIRSHLGNFHFQE